MWHRSSATRVWRHIQTNYVDNHFFKKLSVTSFHFNQIGLILHAIQEFLHPTFWLDETSPHCLISVLSIHEVPGENYTFFKINVNKNVVRNHSLGSVEDNAAYSPDATHQRFSDCQSHEKWNRASIRLDAAMFEYQPPRDHGN